MIVDCVNFNRLIVEASNASENKTRDLLTATREAFLGYELSENSIRFFDYDKLIKKETSKKNAEKEKQQKKQVALTKANMNPQSIKFIKPFFKDYCKIGKEEALLTDKLFNDYVNLVIQRLDKIGINYERYYQNLFRFISPIRINADEYKKLQSIAFSEQILEIEKKQFMALMIKTSIKNLYRTDEVIIKEAYDIQLGMNLTNKLRIPYLEICTELGDRQSAYDLAMLYYNGIDDTPDLVKTYHYCIASESAPAIWTIGWLFQTGVIRKTKKKKKQAEENEFAELEDDAQNTNKKRRAEVVKTDSVTPNYREAIRCYLACTKGRLTYAKAFNSLGNLSILALKEPEVPFSLIQVQQDMNELDTAEYYFTKAIELGDCHAAENMGNLCLRKANTLEDGEEKTALFLRAFDYFSIGEEYEMANCVNRIGEFFLYGYCDLIPTNIQKAEIQFRKAIQLGGSGWAKYNLAKLLLEEKAPISPDDEDIRNEAIQLLKEAAGHHKNQKAQALLRMI